MDREWGTSTLSDDLEGWDWFSVQLSDNTEFMYYRLRRSDGSTSPYSGGSFIDVGGNRRPLGADTVLLTVLDRWKSPTSARTYPVTWQLEIPDENLSLKVEPYLLQQELNLTVRYWEGAMRATGLRNLQPVNGSGYLELAGY
jgi:predicted secreted hydrolase